MFKQLLLDHNKLKRSHQLLLGEKKKSDGEKASALKTAQDEIARLQKELELAKKEKAAVKEASDHQKDILNQLEIRASSAEADLTILKAKAKIWLSELHRINNQMDGEFPLVAFFFTSVQFSVIIARHNL